MHLNKMSVVKLLGDLRKDIPYKIICMEKTIKNLYLCSLQYGRDDYILILLNIANLSRGVKIPKNVNGKYYNLIINQENKIIFEKACGFDRYDRTRQVWKRCYIPCRYLNRYE